jgi:hypothetical protein
MDDYQYEDAMRRSADYEIPLRRKLWVFLTAITFPIWILPYLFVRWLRR